MTVDPDPETTNQDVLYMQSALALASRGLGIVSPNPAVGCVVVLDRRVVGRGVTQRGGRPHAETEAIHRAGSAARGATAYVTLEPCNHHGETPPCSEALINSGVSRVVVAVEDPDERVAGTGVARLEAASIAVTTGVCRKAATDLNAGFFMRVTRGRPLFTLKAATTLDGRIGTRTGESQWITSSDARAMGHRLRASHDAVLIGSGTAIVDDPTLTCRLPGMESSSPIRIVADGRLRLPSESKLVSMARNVATWLVTSNGGDRARLEALSNAGITAIEVDADAAGHPNPTAVASALAARGLTRVLIEGGGKLAASYLAADLVDRIVWFHAPKLIGGDGLPAAHSFGVDYLAKAPLFLRTGIAEIGDDIVETYRSANGP